jgi:PAS domain S-box-containing protein
MILTNYDEIENEIKGLKSGAIDYIRKPIHMESLCARIHVHLEFAQLQKLYEEKLNESNYTLDTIIEQAPIGICISVYNTPSSCPGDGIPIINRKMEEITGWNKNRLLELGWGHITHPDDLQKDIEYFRRLQGGEIHGYSLEKRYIRPDGTIVWAELVVAKLTSTNVSNSNHIALVQDITERKLMEKALYESERSKSILLSNLPGMAYRCNFDRAWTMKYVSDGCFALTGFRPESLINNKEVSFNDIITPEYREAVWKEWLRILPNKKPFQFEYEIETASGQKKWILEMGQGVYNEEEELDALEGILIDITERKESENHLKYVSEHDTWTGLYNRAYLEELLRQDAEIGSSGKKVLVGVNLNAINFLTMAYGFNYSQALIKKIAEALSAYCRRECQLFYTFANRFVFYLRDYENINEVVTFCEKIVNTLESLLMIERISGGIGIIEIDEENKNDVEELLKNLLIASEKAITVADRDFGVCFFDQDMVAQIMREEEIKNVLAKVANDENMQSLFLQFQPIVNMNTDQICAFEALARLKSEKLGFVSPLEFIPIAEKTKYIIPIGAKVIQQAFHFLNKLKLNGHDAIGIAINVSAIQLLRNDFTTNLFELIRKMQIRPENVTLEITESVFVENYQEINNKLSELKNDGIEIAIDDFGTGYSSLARERELNINCLKVDKSFIDTLLLYKQEDSITGDIISMAHKLGHCVVAEGVEHEEQRQFLRNYGCDKIQGYLISKPLDEDDAILLLKDNPPATEI